MFTFLKSKPVLKDLLDNDYIDIHSHILPGIDDGASNLNSSLELISSLKELGFCKMIATPHIIKSVWNNTPETIATAEKSLQIELNHKQLDFPIHSAAEYMLDDGFESLYKNGTLLTLKENYVLVEMSYLSAPIQLYDSIFDLQIAGYKPVLAHPERYSFYHNRLDEYDKLKKAGCLFQLNLLAMVGYYGSEITKTANYLLKKGMYDFVGSDVHHKKHIEGFSQKIIGKHIPELKEAITNNSFFK